MKIEFLYVSECSNATAALSRLNAVVADLAPQTRIHKIALTGDTPLPKQRCFDSVSIRIDGVDLILPKGHAPTDDSDNGNGRPIPPRWLIESGILRALHPAGVLFLCVANSARSQIAEGVARHLAPGTVRVQSAGSRPTAVRPEAALVLSEWGIDASVHHAKSVTEIDPQTVDAVITLCGQEECPVFLGRAYRLHWGLPDPAAIVGSMDTRLDAFRRIRDELRRRLEMLF